VDERLHVEPDPNVHSEPMNPDDVVEIPEYPAPSEGSRRCMIYRLPNDTVR